METNVKILCCNIRVNVQDDIDTGNGWDARKDLCINVMRAQSADLICVQECWWHPYNDLLSRLPEFDGFGLANPAVDFHPYNAMLYRRDRFEVISAGGFWLSETPHIAGSQSWDSARPRFANWMDMKDRESGREFRMWNTHFDHVGQVARENQAQRIVEACQAFPADFPQLFAADCNADASNPAIDVMKAGGWIDTYTEMHGPADPGFTYHAFVGPRYADGKAKDNMTGKIDFIFHRGSVKTLSADVICDSRDGRYPSDHYFLSAEVRLG
jgi:endonuclease/exonuclease/phosphatase family metal-dependent hydrolase